AGYVGRIERKFGKKAFSGRVSARNLLKLDEVGAAGLSILVDSVQVWLVPPAGAFEIDWPVWMTEVRNGRNERFPVLTGARRRRRLCKRTDGIGAVSYVFEHPLRRSGTDTGNKMHQPKAGDTIARVLD